MSKYKAVKGSESGHCCFKGSVINTEAPKTNENGHVYGYEIVAETFEFLDSVNIAALLNKVVKSENI